MGFCSEECRQKYYSTPEAMKRLSFVSQGTCEWCGKHYEGVVK